MGKPEAKVENYLIKQVKASGGKIRKTKWIGRDGCPDRFCWWPGGANAWIECKAEGEEIDWNSPQGREVREMHDDGLTVYVASSHASVDWMIQRVCGS